MNSRTPDAREITASQLSWTQLWHDAPTDFPADAFLKLVHENHRRNFDLWHQEDLARREDIGFESVYKAKRAIDGLNQQRNDFVEQMDKELVRILAPKEDCPANSETPGMIIDRLSILALKVYHMEEQTQRADVSAEHLDRCRQKLGVIRRQRADLTQSLEDLMREVEQGRRTFRVYFQFKMYNDPSLNPQLYAKKAN